MEENIKDVHEEETIIPSGEINIEEEIEEGVELTEDDKAEIEDVFKELENVEVTVEEVRSSIKKNKNFDVKDINDEDIEVIIKAYRTIIKAGDKMVDFIADIPEHTLAKFVRAAKRDGVNPLIPNAFMPYVEGLIREACTTAFIDKGKDIFDKAVDRAKNKSEMGTVLDEYVEHSYYSKVNTLTKLIESEDSNEDVKAEAKAMLDAVNDSVSLDFIFDYCEKNPTIFNINKLLKKYDHHRDSVGYALRNAGINAIDIMALYRVLNYHHPEEAPMAMNVNKLVITILSLTSGSKTADVVRIYGVLLNAIAAYKLLMDEKEPTEFYKNFLYKCELLFHTITKGIENYAPNKEF